MVQRGNVIPVLVVSGFLGSGKTTLIRGLLRNPRMKEASTSAFGGGEVAVIVNEFEAVVHDLKAQLAHLNPAVSIINGPFGAVDFDALCNSELRHTDPHGIRQWEDMDDGSPALQRAHAPGGGITSGCIVVDRPLNWH